MWPSMINSLFATALVALLTGCGNSSPEAATAEPFVVLPESVATQAMARTAAFIRDCTPRDAGTDGARHAAEWLTAALTELGFPAGDPSAPSLAWKLDEFREATPHGERPFRNVLAAVPARDPGNDWIVLLSHFDTKSGIAPRFEGANDGASSTALLLELAGWFKAHPLHRTNILCGFMDGEECQVAYSDQDGFHGSKRLAHQMKKRRAGVRAVILMDMVGDANLRLTVPRNGNAALRLLALEAAEAVGERDQIGLFDGYIYDDHHAFFELGFPAIDLIDFEYGNETDENAYWHTPQDTIDKLSPRSLYTTAKIVQEMIRRLDNSSR